jgi:drug/metabolite transporter, DME family
MADALPAPLPAVSRYTGALLVVAGASLWGSLGAFFRTAESIHRPAPAAEAFVVFVAMLVVGAPFSLRAKGPVPKDAFTWGRLALLGACEAGSFLSYAAAMQKTSIAVASLTHYAAPILVCFCAPVVLGERLSPRAKLALPVCVAGLVLLTAPWRGGEAARWTGAMLGLLSAVFFAANLLLTRSLSATLSPPRIVAWPKPFALLVLALFLDRGALSLAPAAASILAVGGVVAGAFACALFYAGLQRVTASNASLLCLVEPIVSVCIGVALFGEGLSASGFAGALLVVAGAALAVTPSTDGSRIRRDVVHRRPARSARSDAGPARPVGVGMQTPRVALNDGEPPID